MSTTHLTRQAERIIDEGEGRYRRVIVQMAEAAEPDAEVLAGAADAQRHRALSSSARALLPAPAAAFSRGTDLRLTASQRRHQRTSLASFASQVAASTASQPVRKPSKVQRRAAARKEFARLEKSDVVSQIAARKTGAASMQKIWSAGAMALEVTPDELQKLATEVEGVAAVYPNRILRVPAIAKVQRLPANVADEKASAWGVQAVGALASWGAFGSRGAGITVGVLDTGVDATHPDLAGKVAAFAEFDLNGNVVPGAATRDDGQHGTHVCGTVVGGNASGAWIGVAPEARVAVGMVLVGGVGSDSQVLAGIDWAIAQGVDVISMSLGGLSFDPEVFDTYTRAMLTAAQLGIPVVIAIGNDGHQTSGSPGSDLFAFAVGATDVEDRVAGFSGGRTQVITQSRFIDPRFLPLPYSKPDVSAPGIAVTSSVPGGGWEAWNGTSMATPHVAGCMALLLSATGLRAAVPVPEQAFVLHDLIAGSVEELGEAGQDHRFGWGRVDVLRAIGFARERGF
jgi:subtilisin family serine protease